MGRGVRGFYIEMYFPSMFLIFSLYGSWGGLVGWKILRQSPLTISTPGKPNYEKTCFEHLYYQIFFPNIGLSNNPTSYKASPASTSGKSCFRRLSSYHIIQQTTPRRKTYLKDFATSLLQPGSYLRKLTKPSFSN